LSPVRTSSFQPILPGLFLILTLTLPVLSRAQVQGGCAQVACFDGSMHPCGFDCQAYYYRLHPQGGGNNGGGAVYTGPSPEQIAAQQRRDASNQLVNQGQTFFNEGQWAQAANSFQAALDQDPTNDSARQYLKNAQDKIDFENSKNDALHDMKGFSDDNGALKGGGDTGGLKGVGGDDPGGLKDPSNDEPAPPRPHPAPFLHHAKKFVAGLGDETVLEAEGPVPDMGPDIEHSPALADAHKGFKCLQQQDWPAALVWFEQGLVKDPKNPALLRLVDLGKYTLRRRKELEAEKAVRSAPVDSDILFLFPAEKQTHPPTAEEWAKADAALDQSLSNLINAQLLAISERQLFEFLGKRDIAHAKEELKFCIRFAPPDQTRYREALEGIEKAEKAEKEKKAKGN